MSTTPTNPETARTYYCVGDGTTTTLTNIEPEAHRFEWDFFLDDNGRPIFSDRGFLRSLDENSPVDELARMLMQPRPPANEAMVPGSDACPRCGSSTCILPLCWQAQCESPDCTWKNEAHR